LKFFNFIKLDLEKYFEISESHFKYDDKKTGTYYFKIKQRKDVLVSGPPIDMKEACLLFKKVHKNTFTKSGKLYSKEKSLSIGPVLKKIDKKIMLDMGIIGLK